MTAVDAFHTKQAAYECLRDPHWGRFAEGFTASLRGEKSRTLAQRGYSETGPELTRRLASAISVAEAFYVAPMMTRLVTAAAEAWEEDEPVLEEDFPLSHGWMYVPGGLTSIDVRGQALTTSAVTWAVRGGRVELTWWADKRHDPPALRAKPGWAEAPQWTPWHLTELRFGEPLPRSMRMGTLLPPEVSEKISWVDNGTSTAMMFPQGWTPDQMAPSVRPDEVAAWLVSALRIMQQPLASIDRKGLPANVRKGLQRRPVRMKNKSVTVVDFRRREGDYNSGTGREYSHRFLRRGHWRRQPFKREDGTWDRRRIWIHPTIVGDPDKPLVLRNHVQALTR